MLSSIEEIPEKVIMKTATFKYSCHKSDEQNVLFEFQNEMLF